MQERIIEELSEMEETAMIILSLGYLSTSMTKSPILRERCATPPHRELFQALDEKMEKEDQITVEHVITEEEEEQKTVSERMSDISKNVDVREETAEPLVYDQDLYKEYLSSIRKKWSGWNEEILVSRFPCLQLFVEQYTENILSKRSKMERSFLESGKVEFKSLIQSKGRIMTITGQFFALLEAILPKSTTFSMQDLFSLKKIQVYLQFLEDLEREPCTIRNSVLTLKHILKKLLNSNTFQHHHQEIKETSHFLDQTSSRKKTQEFNKTRPNAEDLLENGHFMEEEEFSLFIAYLLQQTKFILEKKEKSMKDLFELQYHCYSLMSLLDCGKIREVVPRLQIDALTRNGSQFFLEKLIENHGRENFHEIPLLDISALLFFLWKKERKAILEQNGHREDLLMSLWITEHFKPARPDNLMSKMKQFLRKFNPCLQITKLDLRRWKIPLLFEKMEKNHFQLTQMDIDLEIVSNYLNTSLDYILIHSNHHSTNAQKRLNLIQPISGEMNKTSIESQEDGVVPLEETEQHKDPVIKRYVRRTLDKVTHEHEFETWKQELERNQNTSFEELYKRLGGRKRKEMEE